MRVLPLQDHKRYEHHTTVMIPSLDLTNILECMHRIWTHLIEGNVGFQNHITPLILAVRSTYHPRQWYQHWTGLLLGKNHHQMKTACDGLIRLYGNGPYGSFLSNPMVMPSHHSLLMETKQRQFIKIHPVHCVFLVYLLSSYSPLCMHYHGLVAARDAPALRHERPALSRPI